LVCTLFFVVYRDYGMYTKIKGKCENKWGRVVYITICFWIWKELSQNLREQGGRNIT